MLTYELFLCVTSLSLFTFAYLTLTPAEESRLKEIIDLIFIVPNSAELPLQDLFRNNSSIVSKSQIWDFSEKDIKNCKCVCSNGKDVRTPEDPCYNLKKCCEPEQKIIHIDPKLKGCGIRNPSGIGARSINSDEALYGEFPWTVAVLCETGVDQHNKTFISFQCGGSIIHPQVILTAAHCVLKRFRQYYIRAGEWDTRVTLELFPHQNRQVKEILVHYEFDKTSLTNDIALLILREPLILNQNVQPVCLPSQDGVVDYASRCYASGWGVDVFGMYQPILKKVEVPIVRRDICEERLKNTKLGKSFFLADSFICAGGQSKKDTCQGDGGSPLVCPLSSNSKRYYQWGIVSWGVGCGESNIPGIYVNVALFRKWIDYHMERYQFEAFTYTHGID